MILHQQLPHSKSDPLPWFAVHCETLTLALCMPIGNRGRRLLIAVFPHATDAVITSSLAGMVSAPNVIGELIFADVAKSLQVLLQRIETLPNPESSLPEYLLLNSLAGTAPAIMHTSDPVFIAFADPATAILRAPEHYRSSVDLSVAGWEYWWTDAQQHFEKLSVESAAAHGITVPADIAAQA